MNKYKFAWSLILITLLIACSSISKNKLVKNDSTESKRNSKVSFASYLQWTGAKIEDANFSIWGSSPILGDDGKIHVFCARWPEKDIDPAWRKSSEVAHYVADTPEGPFKFSDVAVKGSGVEGVWDCYAPHNPEVKKIGNYYVIVFIANDDYHQPPHPANQRIGIVYSESLYGPWKKAGKNGMIIEASKDSTHWTFGSKLGVDNPCLLEVEGKPVVYFKNRINENGQIKSRYGYATAENIEGPYKMSDQPITNNDSYLEDATAFIWNNTYYLITTDNFGSVTGVEGGGILWSSKNWRSFDVKNTELAYNLIPVYNKAYNPNKVRQIYSDKPKFERPKILMINNEPAYLFAPSGWNIDGGERSVCYILKIINQP